jgi:hypothetical protein
LARIYLEVPSGVLFHGIVGFFEFPSQAKVVGGNVVKKEVKDKIENCPQNDYVMPNNSAPVLGADIKFFRRMQAPL